ncbi:hypothetical protein Curi_c14940 [Gottschalkia acidurici 9a]|uniref:Uncharacterized protein n=1 Tax=Gottschalkia acidurici (strain ATCC 7906 / DSM 604 / BCRC 14475 / CIP 104303 / KCTC 5404 / NCIMB 10678 / 9a) TaxID=1128398 RepID=K0AXF5_GOTA9|nr:hypothetical protein Curi_c14940 [Gottschalkia acidurici 9a]
MKSTTKPCRTSNTPPKGRGIVINTYIFIIPINMTTENTVIIILSFIKI